MAVAFEGFCIREFASKMRSVDVVKSWPFGGDSDKEQIESALPPITVAKFRWWQHELDAARSSHAGSSDAAADLEEKSEEPLFGCTVCGAFKASGTENAAAEAEIGNFEKQLSTRARSKTKAPKKRSIVEIFAVAPQIETVTRQEGSSSGTNSESTRVKKKKKMASLKKKHLPILDRKLKKKVRRNASFAMKEISHKLKRKTTSELSRNFDRLRNTMCTSGKLEDADGTHRRNPSCKPSSSHKKPKNIAPSKFITKKHKEVVTPVRGILKKQRKYVSGKDTAYTVPEENSQAADQLDKHVRFLVGNDEIDGEANTHAVTQQSNLHEIFTGVDRLSRNEVEVEVEAVSENDNPICVEEFQVDKEREITLPDTHSQGNVKNCVQLSTFQEDLNNFPELPTSPNHHIPKFCGDLNRSSKGKSVVSDDASYPWHSRFHYTFNCASSNADVAGSSVRPRLEFTSSHQAGSGRAAYAVGSVTRTTNVNDQRLPFPSQSMISDPSFIRPHQMNPIGGSLSYKEWNPIGVTSSERSLNENLYGLPLNSRGELIHLSSSGNLMLDQQSCPSRRYPVQPEDTIRLKGKHTGPKDLNLFPIQDYADETPRMNINPSSHLFGADLNLMCPNGQGTKVVAATDPPVTMRLMGKDVSIGRNSRIRSEEDKVWTDKEIIFEHNNNNNSGTHLVKNFFPVQDPVLKTPIPEKSRGGLVNISFGGQNNSDYYNYPPPPDPYRVRDPYINWQPDATVQIGRVPITRPTIFQVENVRDPYLNAGVRVGSHESNWIDIQWGPDPIYRPNNVPRVPYNFGFPSDCRECFPPPPHATSDRRSMAYTNHRAQHFYGAPPANRWCSSSSTQPRFHFPEPYYYNPMASQSQMRSPLSVENVHSNYRVDSGGFGFGDHTRARKRPAVFDVDLRKPFKAPTLELQVFPGIETVGRNVEHRGLEFYSGKESNIQGVISDRAKPSPGPTKLRAGAKHILKPCQNTDSGNSGPAHSNTPF